MPSPDSQRLAYRDKFRSLHNETFQSWFEELAHAIHPVGDFQSVRKTSGDGGLDGFVVSSQLVYQVYAPARIEELRDSETAAKIEADFRVAYRTLSGKLKAWTFVHNHPEAKLGKMSIAAISNLKATYPAVDISVLDIDSLWQKIVNLPHSAIQSLVSQVSVPAQHTATEHGTASLTQFESLPANLSLQHYSCFLSYARQDSEFAEQLHTDLNKCNITCWQDKHDLRGGVEWQTQINKAIKSHDKIVLICSIRSVYRNNVVKEIVETIAVEREMDEKKLFPIRLDDHIISPTMMDEAREKVRSGEWAENWVYYVQKYQIPDFSNWKDPEAYKREFDKLLRDLKNPIKR